MASTGFYLHPASALHDTGWGHPEHQGRLRALASAVGRDLLALHGPVTQIDLPEFEAVALERVEPALLRVHTPEHLAGVRAGVAAAVDAGTPVPIDADTMVSSASWDAAAGSVAGLLDAVERVADRSLRNAFVAARPPGHHATPGRAMGFCLFNTIAVAARELQASGRAERVLIVDWDVHHGNGTQDVFYEDASVFFCSLHQAPHWPGTGAEHETGAGAGEGTTLNVPLAAGTRREDFLGRFEEAMDRVAGTFVPDFVLVSSGFDAMAGDPLGGQLLEPEDFHAMTRSLVQRAEAWCDGRLAVTLEGGYVPARLGQGTVAVLRALANLEDS